MSKFEVCALYVLSFEIVRTWKAINIFSDISILLFFWCVSSTSKRFHDLVPRFRVGGSKTKKGKGGGEGRGGNEICRFTFF